MSAWSQGRNQLFGSALYTVARITSRTARFQISGGEHFHAATTGDRPTIIAAWHGMTMMMAGFFDRYLDVSKLVLILPDDWRGGVLNVFAHKLGATPFPMNLTGDGSLSAARRLAKLIRLVQSGRNSYINPDGPDGPAHVPKPGIAFIARKANATILPVGAYTRHGYRQPRWDRYVVPYPFCRISIFFSEPIAVPEGVELAEVMGTLTDTLNRATLQAAANYYEKPDVGPDLIRPRSD